MADETPRGEAASAGDGSPRKKGLVDWALSPLAEVRPGEGVSALLLMLNVFLLLFAYYLLKSFREGVIAKTVVIYGWELKGPVLKSVSSGAQAALLVVVVVLYGAIARRLAPIRLITAVTLFFGSNLALFYVLRLAGVDVGVPFFIWVGIFNVFVIAQFWAFANDVYTHDQGKRLFAIVGLGASTGAVVGSYLVRPIVRVLGLDNILTVALGLLLLSLGLTFAVHLMRGRGASSAGARDRKPEEPLGKEGGFALLLGDRYLLLIGLTTLLLNFVNTNGEFILASALKEAVPHGLSDEAAEAWVVAWMSDYFFWVSLLGMLLQLFAVSRVLKYVGVERAVFILPIISLLGSTFLAFIPILGLIRVAKIAENATDYSVQNTTKQALWLITSREAKYKAKAAVDTFLVRIGDVASAALAIGGTALSFVLAHYVYVNLALIAIWIVAVVVMSRIYRRRIAGVAERAAAAPPDGKPAPT